MKKLVILFVFSIFIFPSLTNAATFGISSPSNNIGLVGWWTMDGKDVPNGRVNDVSGNGNNGNLINIATSTFYVPGKIGQGFKFGGTNQVKLPNSSAYNFNSTNNFTISAWVYSPLTGNVYIFNTMDGPGNFGYVFSLANTTGTISVRVRDSGGNVALVNSASSVFSVRRWNHIIMTFTSTSTVGFYVNGVSKTGGVLSKSLASTSAATPAYIGFFPNISAYTTGSLDDVRIYNRALSAAEITQLYNQGAATKQAASPNVTATTSSCSTGLSCGLVGYWTFDGKDTPWTSATAATTLDKSGSGNTGTLTNMAQATSPVAGKVGQGLKFDGVSSKVDLGASPTALNLSVFSISFWLKGGLQSSGQYDGGVFDNRISGKNGFQIANNQASNPPTGFQAYLVVWNGTSETQNLSGGPTIAYPFTSFHHYVITWDGSTAYVYIDDIRYTMSNSGRNNWGDGSANHAMIGYTYSYINGIIDDVRIYNRALSATEVLQLYNQGAATKQAASPTVTTTSCSTGLSCGLVGYWTFDGKDTPWTSATAATTLDKSGSGNTGTLTNMAQATSPVAGKIGQGLKFDGVNDYVNTGSDMIGTGADSISMWVYPRIIATGYYLVSNAKFAIQLLGSSQFRFTSNGFGNIANSGNNLKVNSWNLVTVTRDASGVANLYINGILSGSANQNSGTPTAGTQNLIITNYSDAFSGSLDDVRIYNRALSAAEIRQLYNLGK